MIRSLSRTLVLLVCLVVGMAALQPANAQLGVAAGLNFQSLEDFDTGSAQATYESSTGYHVGLFYDVAVGPLALRPGLFYRDIGSYVVEDDEFDINLIEIPLDVRFRLFALPFVKPYLLASPVLNFPQGDEAFGEGLNDFAVSGNVGLGVEFALPGAGFRLMPEFRYAFGLQSYFSDESFQLSGVTFDPSETPNESAYMLRLNVGF